jgi:hypothetical protein
MSLMQATFKYGCTLPIPGITNYQAKFTTNKSTTFILLKQDCCKIPCTKKFDSAFETVSSVER